MFKRICKFLLAFVFVLNISGEAFAAANFGMPDIGDYGTWATDANREMVTEGLTNDINKFVPNTTKQLLPDYVPIEAKVGMAFINALSHVAHIIDNALARFAIIFIILM